MDGMVPYYFKPLYFVVKKPQVLHTLTEKLHFAWGKNVTSTPVYEAWRNKSIEIKSCKHNGANKIQWHYHQNRFGGQ